MSDKNPTRVRVLGDGETKEWSVLQPDGTWESPHRPVRLFVRAEPSGLLFIEEAIVTSAKETAERLEPEGDDDKKSRVILRRDDARWLLDVLPAALDHANRDEAGDSSRVLHEDRHPASAVTLARALARELRVAKQGTHPWTIGECALLSQICDVLGVDRHDGGLEQ